MANKYVPDEIDEYFLIDILLVFLMINYDLPLATIYLGMALVGSLMYYVAADQRLFVMIPFAKKEGKMISIAIGVALGVGFIYFYNWLGSLTPMANVFATVAFGESQSVYKFVFGFLIPVIETRFFFRTIMQWYAWKTNTSTNDSVLSVSSIMLMVIFAAVFTIFHATTKGIENSIDLIATFAFGVMSVAAVLITQNELEATTAHVVVNSHAVGIFESIFKGGFISFPLLIVGAIVGYMLLSGKNGIRLPWVS